MSLFDYMVAKTILEERPPLKNPLLELELYVRLAILPFLLGLIPFFSEKFQPACVHYLFMYFVYIVFCLVRLGAVQKLPSLFQFFLLMVIPVITYWAETSADWYQPYKTELFFGWLIFLPVYATFSLLKAFLRKVKNRGNVETTVVPEPLNEPLRLSDKERISELEKQLASIKNQVGLK